MSMWEYMAALDGYAKVHCPKDDGSMSDEDRDVLWEMVQERS